MQIEIDLLKLERGLRVGRVKVTRDGKTFWREQRVGRQEKLKVEEKQKEYNIKGSDIGIVYHGGKKKLIL